MITDERALTNNTPNAAVIYAVEIPRKQLVSVIREGRHLGYSSGRNIDTLIDQMNLLEIPNASFGTDTTLVVLEYRQLWHSL